MTLDEILRRKALAEPMPLSWACDQLAQALRLLKVVEATMPELHQRGEGPQDGGRVPRHHPERDTRR